MAHFRQLPKETLHWLAGEVGKRLTRGRGAGFQPHPDGKLELAEHFEVWLLDRHSLRTPEERMASIARRTGRWHHQIRRGGVATEFARSAPHGPGQNDWVLTSLFTSPIARKIDEAIRWLDANTIGGDPLVRLLTVPYHLLHAFWVESELYDRFLLISKPDSIVRLEPWNLYSLEEFLGALAAQPQSNWPR